MSEIKILSLVTAVGWHAIYDNGDGTVFSAPVVALAAIRESGEGGSADSVVPVVMSDGYWIPTEDGNLLAVCHESGLETATAEWAAYARAQVERVRKASS